jgi:S1-C subfamily serine protease
MKNTNFVKGILIGFATLVVVLVSMFGGALADRLFLIKPLDALVDRRVDSVASNGTRQILREESAVIEVVEETSPSVVTVSVETPQRRILQFDPFGGIRSQIQGGVPQDIGSGFIVSDTGLIITNKHVVDRDAEYKIITQDGVEHEVRSIHKDPANDLAILETDAKGYKPLVLGNSDELRVGQFVIAIGTALGEFRHTVTTGVVSGLGRGITAGSAFEGFVERLDNVIQTDAAINPGNSGGPLLNASGEVIGVNVAVASGAENIGFALPVNLVKDGIAEYQASGTFASRAFLGVEHSLITKEAAILNEVPQGAYVSSVVPGSAAEAAGIQEGDIITKIDSKSVADNKDGLAGIISQYKVGDRVRLEVWRDLPAEAGGETLTLEATLSSGS